MILHLINKLNIRNFQHRWSRGRSKERGYHAHSHAHHHDGEAHDSEGTDYAADNSSDHSSSATHSPRHRPLPYGDSPLARAHLAKIDKRDSLSSQNDPTITDTVRSTITAAQVQTPCHMPQIYINHAFNTLKFENQKQNTKIKHKSHITTHYSILFKSSESFV